MFYVYKIPFRQYECFSVHVIVRDKTINQLNYLKQYLTLSFNFANIYRAGGCNQFCGDIMIYARNEGFLVIVWCFY